MEIKKLAYDELQKFKELQREKSATAFYEEIEGDLKVTDIPKELYSMNPEQRLLLVQDIHLHNGYVIGAFVDGEMVGMAALDCQYISGFRLRLAELVIHGGQREVAVDLLNQVKQHAQQLEAEALYICAAASKEVIEFYLEQGAKLARRTDGYLRQLYEAEIHLDISLELR